MLESILQDSVEGKDFLLVAEIPVWYATLYRIRCNSFLPLPGRTRRAHILSRIHELSVTAERKMQKESGCSSAASHRGDLIASLYLLIQRRVDILTVTVIGHFSILMQQDDIVAVFRRETRFIDSTVGCRHDIRALRGHKINALMRPHLPADGMHPFNESV